MNPRRRLRPIAATLAISLAGFFAWALALLPVPENLAPLVAQYLDQSGVTHPVTAVLLNFRGYDTFLELAVLLLAVLGAWSLGRHTPMPLRTLPGPVVPGMARLLAPTMVVIGIYLLWTGTAAPGGAFQSGAVLGAAGVLLVLTQPRSLPVPPRLLLRLGLTAGVTVFLIAGVSGQLMGFGFMGYPPGWARTLIVVIETAAALSIAVTLVALFVGGSPAPDAGEGGP